jgi:hypothetical protein
MMSFIRYRPVLAACSARGPGYRKLGLSDGAPAICRLRVRGRLVRTAGGAQRKCPSERAGQICVSARISQNRPAVAGKA